MPALQSQRKKTKRSAARFVGGARPTWEIAYLVPPQGSWTEDDYLALEDHYGTQIRVELADGRRQQFRKSF